MRIAVLTTESLASAVAVRRFVASHAADIALVGLSDPYRPEAGGAIGQGWRRLRQSGPLILPYLALNFSIPRLVGLVARSRRAGTDRTPLARACRKLAIPVLMTGDVNGDAFRQELARSGAELLVTFHFDQILTADTIASVPRGGINVHPALLPRHRGPVPTIHALVDRPIVLGVSVHRLAARIDAGALLAQVTLADEPGLTALGAARRLHEAALPLLDRVLGDIATGRAADTPLATLPYRGFPSPAELTSLHRSGRSAAGWSDLKAALATPI